MDSLFLASLRRLRNQRDFSLLALSTRAGLSPQHLSEIESGKRDPRLSSVEKIADAMNMTVLLVPDHLVGDVRRFVNSNGRAFAMRLPAGRYRVAQGRSRQGPRPLPGVR